MKAYVVDPKRCRVFETDLPNNDRDMMREIKRIIGADRLEHTTISDEHDQLWLDDLGLTRGCCWGWKLVPCGFRPQNSGVRGGCGVIIGTDDLGKTRAPFVPLDCIRRDIVWLGEIVPELTTVSEERMVFGRKALVHRTIVTYSRAGP